MAGNTISGAISAYQNTANIAGNVGKSSNVDFSSMLEGAIDNSISTLRNSESVSSSALVNDISIEELAGAVANAELTLKTVVAVRDRIIGAYQDIIKMPI